MNECDLKKVKEPPKNGFGIILNIVSNVLLGVGIMIFLSLAKAGASIPEWIMKLGLPPVIFSLVLIAIIAITIKIPAKILMLLADIEYNTRSKD